MGYSHTQQLLRKRYGDPHIILSTYRKEIRNWPKLKFGDAKGFRKFYNFLVKCEGVAKGQLWNAINTPDIICMLASKLPNGLIDRWNRTAYNIRKRQECEPSLNDLIEFVDQETSMVNDPMFPREALECYCENLEKPNGKRYRRVKSLRIETKINVCSLCSARHGIEECDELKKLLCNDRSKVFFKKRLCYVCRHLIGDGHNFKTCTKRRKCRDCDGKHPTILHGLQLKKNDRRIIERNQEETSRSS